MNRFKWAACCAVVAGLVGWGWNGARAQVGEADVFGGVSDAEVDPFDRADANQVEEAKAEAPRDFCRCVGEVGPAVARIKRVLDEPLLPHGMEFTDTPLEEVVSQLQEDYNIPIQLDFPALDLVGLGPDEPVNVSLRNITLRSALRLMLKQLQLTYLIRV
jgi:hypothetical protein